MKLLLLSADFLPYVGGVSMMMHHLANAMVDQGVDALIGPPPPSGKVALTQMYKTMQGPREPWVHESHWYRIRQHTARLRVLTERALSDFPADAVLLGSGLHNPRDWHGVYAACRSRDVPLAVVAHGGDVRLNIVRRNIKKEIGGAILGVAGVARSPFQGLRWSLRNADVVFTNSRYTAGLVREVSGRAPVVTGCGLADDDYERETHITPRFERNSKQHWRSLLGLPERPTVTFIGRLVPHKNVRLILKALADLPAVQVVIVGDGSDAVPLREMAESLDLSGRVNWMGKQDEEMKWKCLRASDAFCLPSKEATNGSVEGFGIVLLEAAAAGTPVIATKAGGMIDVVDDRKTGLLCPSDDARALARAIQSLVTDDNLAASCVAAARLQIEQRFNWPSVAATIVETLDEAVQRRRHPNAEFHQSTLRTKART